MRIKLADIYIGERVRQDYGKSEMDDLKRDMEENGQITAITVRPPNDEDRRNEDYSGQPWVLVAGGRRTMAAALLGWEDIEGYAREELSPLVHRILELHENLQRKAMTWQEEVKAKREIVELRRRENPEITAHEVAKELGQSPSTFSRDIKTAQLLETNPGLRNAGTKHAALSAGKLLEEHKIREQRITQMPSSSNDLGILPLDERVVTDDALAFAKRVPANSVDLFLVDGPYGYNYWKQGQKSTGSEGEHLSAYDDDPERTAEIYQLVVPEMVRAARETGWLMFFSSKETYDFIEELLGDCCATHASYRHSQYPRQCEAATAGAIGSNSCRFLRPEPFPWIWYRPNSQNNPRFKELHAKNMMELILVCNMGKGRIVKHPCPNVLIHDAEYGPERVHANQKPVALYRDLIERVTFTGDTMVDLFFGSGNSLAAAASLARIPWGCDKNPAMLPFALGSIRKWQQPVSKEAIQRSFERYQMGLANPIVVAPAEEIEPTTAERQGPARKSGIRWEYEVFRVGARYIGYLKYDGHNMGQRHGNSEEEISATLELACERLDQLSTLGIIDPCCCSPEEAMEALANYEASAALEVQ